MGDQRETGPGGLTIPGGTGLIPAVAVFELILGSMTGSEAMERLERLPRIPPPSVEIPSRFAALQDVMNELLRQDAKWGEQNHADGTGPQVGVLNPLSKYLPSYDDDEPIVVGDARAQELADAARAACQANGRPDSPDTWAAILLEEVFEAMAEDDLAPLRTELLQVAAVAVQWVLAIDRKAGH